MDEPKLFPHPTDIGPLVYSLPRRKRQPGDMHGLFEYFRKCEGQLLDAWVAAQTPPKNEDK